MGPILRHRRVGGEGVGCFVYTMAMNERTLHGGRAGDDQSQMWADGSEAGCDPQTVPGPAQGALMPSA